MRDPLNQLEERLRSAILCAILRSGRAPAEEPLRVSLGISGRRLRGLLRSLEKKDYIVRDRSTGEILVAYPLSVPPTGHVLRLKKRKIAYAVCAVDALGVSGMVGEDLKASSSCPACGSPIRLSFREGELQRVSPPGTVVWSSLPRTLKKSKVPHALLH